MLVKVMGVMELCVILPVILFFFGGGEGGLSAIYLKDGVKG